MNVRECPHTNSMETHIHIFDVATPPDLSLVVWMYILYHTYFFTYISTLGTS